MPDPLPELPPPEPTPPPPPRKRGLTWLAWAVILLIVAFEVLAPQLRKRLRSSRPRAADETAGHLQADMQVRQVVGMAELLGSGQRSTFYTQAKENLDTGPVADRLRLVVLAGDLAGPDEALAQLQRLDEQTARQGVEVTKDEAVLMAALGRLYGDRGGADAALSAVAGLTGPDGQPWVVLGLTAAKPNHEPQALTEEDRELLRRQLGWCGELALTPPDADPADRARVLAPARRLAITLLAVLVVASVLGLLGLLGLVTWFAFFFIGRIRPALPPPTRHGGIYAEAFAVYMAVFLGLGIAHAFLPWQSPELLLGGAGMLISLAAGLVWPVLRGVPWRQVRQEVGLTLGRHPLLEPVVGLFGYALILPVFGIGIIVSYILISLDRRLQLGEHPEQHFDPIEQPTHPVVEWLAHPDWRLLLQVVILASVLAPLVEETMFRGVLYRHLRNATARLGRTASFLVSAVVVSFLFAVIHPQGVLAVPALMALAVGLTILREWRGSLLPSMMVHGIHNGLTTFVLVQSLRG
jgi:membrane protease YdiL (CAAX protease family)